jgi:SAM-dependent methyltransferase
VYDDWYGDVTDVDGTVATMLTLGGPVLELGIGTGRLALPMVAAGLAVTGVDASAAMVAALRTKPGGSDLEVLVADMSEHLPPGPFATVLLACNTIFNLSDPIRQAAVFAQAAAVLSPGGHLVIEAAVPAESSQERAEAVRVRSIDPDRVVLSVSAAEPNGQVFGQFIDISADGIVMRPWRIRMIGPAQLDDLAERAGFTLLTRHAGWRRERFGPDAETHVSIYRWPGPVTGEVA